MISAESIKIADEAKFRLFRCVDKDSVNDVFSSYGIDDPEAKIELLRRCMQVKDVYSAPCDMSVEDVYEEDLSFFVDGSWRQLI
jgi:hypothetical protein